MLIVFAYSIVGQKLNDRICKMAGSEGFEPSAYRLRADRSTWLSYEPEYASESYLPR
jgi:hypothetical protein